MLCAIWTANLVVFGAIFMGGIDVYFNWITTVSYSTRQYTVLMYGFGGTTFVAATLITMIAYTKVFLVVRRQVSIVRENVKQSKTRKLCYRKDDRAMRPIAYMGAMKIFGTP